MSVYDKYPPKKTADLARDLMKELNINAAELARRANVCPSTISRLLSGKRKPGMDVYMALTNIGRFVFRE